MDPELTNPWVPAAEITAVLDVDAFMDHLVQQVTADDIWNVLETSGTVLARLVMDSIGMPSAKPTRAAAAQLLAKLRSRKVSAGAYEFGIINMPLMHALTGDLEPALWESLLTQDEEKAVRTARDLGDALEHLQQDLDFMAEPFNDIALLCAIVDDLPTATIALGLLAARHDAAGQAWQALSEADKFLPARPTRDLHELFHILDAAMSADAADKDLVDAVEEVAGLDSDDVATADLTAADVLGEGLTPAQTRLGLFDLLIDSTRELLAGLERGDMPGVPAAVVRVNSRMLAQGGVPEVGARAHLEALVSVEAENDRLAQQDEQDRAWVAQLRALSGPDTVQADVDAVRAAVDAYTADADDAPSRDALFALHRLLELGARRHAGEQVAFDDIMASESSVRERWPAIPALVTAASYGYVTIPPLDEVPDRAGETEPPAQQGQVRAVDADPVVDDVAETVEAPDQSQPDLDDEQEQDADEGQDADDEQASDAVELDDALGPEDDQGDGQAGQDGHYIDGDPGSDEGPSGRTTKLEQETQTDETAHADIDLSGLDELLDQGAAPTLVRSAPAPEVAPAGATTAKTHASAAPDDDTARLAASDDALNGSEDEDVTEGELTTLTWPAPAVTNAIGTATADLRLGLAADIALAAGAPTSSVRARQLATYSLQLRNPGGSLAAAFSADATHLHRDTLGDDRPAQLLAWAAAARIALLAPSAGPAQVLTEFGPCVADLPALTTVTDALIEAARSGVVVLPETRSEMGSVAAAEDGLAAAKANLEVLLGTMNRRVLSYQPANAIYQEWISSTGKLGALLLMAVGAGVDDVPVIRKAVLDLRGDGEREAKAAHKRANKSNKIFEPVMRDLTGRWESILSALDAWCAATLRMSSTENTVASGTWQTQALSTVRSRVNATVREQALTELDGENSDDPMTSGTLEAVRELLAAAFDACDGLAPSGEEPTPELAVHGELLALAAPDLPDHLAGITADDLAHHLPQLLELANTDELSPEELYQALASAGHHDQTQMLLDLLTATEPAMRQKLYRTRGGDLAERRAHRDGSIKGLRRRLDTQRMSGGLTEDDWSTLASRVDALADAARTDFGRISAEAEAIAGELDTLRTARIAETIDRINERGAQTPAVAVVSERLTALAIAGNIASAEEYLEQAASGGALPESDTEQNEHLGRFFPAVPDAFNADAKTNEKLSRFLRSGDTSEVGHLIEAGLDLAGMSRGRVDEARRAFEAMRELSQSLTAKTIQSGTVQQILTQAGYDFAALKADPPAARRRWLTLTGVRTTGRAMHPALGSGMSPEGTSLRVLLVWGDQQPQSLVEWVRDEAPDRTVLALWLGRALSAQQRRDLTEASRGHSRPVVAVLDAAALAYLAAQPARTLETFASIALPFTAASPYKDTPGDAAPEMFYGRRAELEHVMDPSGPSFVSGGRQLGKSALLRAAERKFPTGGPGRVAILRSLYSIGPDGDSSTLWPALWSDLATHGIVNGPMPADNAAVADAVHDSIRAWVAASSTNNLLVLLDEADAFLDADAEGNRFSAVDRCRRLMLETSRRVKFVFAGLHRTARFDSLPNQPLSHLGQITVGPLAPRHAHDLITAPLAAMGFTYQDPVGTPARILALANNMPALLQLFGAALVQHLTSRPVGAGQPPSLITDDDIDTVWDDPDLRGAFREKYVLTLNLDHRYLVIAFTVAHAAHEHGVGYGMTLRDLSFEARSTWPEGFASCGADDFRALVTECVDLGLLTRDRNTYRMRTPTVLRLLGTQEEVIEALVDASLVLVVADATATGAFRRRTSVGRSPLTERQLADVLSGLGSVTLVTGCDATGIDRVADALAETVASQDIKSHTRTVTTLASADASAVTSAVAEASTGTLVVVDVRGAAARVLTDLTAAAETAVRTTAAVGAVLVADATSWPAWPVTTRRVSLARVDVPGLRLLCDEAGLPFHNDEAAERLHLVTGGWPTLVEHVLNRTQPSGTVTVDSVVQAAVDYSDTHRAALGRAALSSRVPLLAALFDKVVEFTHTGAEDLDTVVDLIAMDADALAGVVDPVQDVQATVANGVEALRTLGLLETTTRGAVRAEPVLAATRQARGAEG